MDAQVSFEWSGEKAKNCVTKILGDNDLVTAKIYDDLILRDDADYEVMLIVKLKHKRKARKKKEAELKIS